MTSPMYGLVAGVFGLYLRLVYRVRVIGLENVPRAGPVVFYVNHRSWWDIPLVGALLGRRVHFMAKAELFRYPFFGWLIRRLGAFPVRRDEPDRAALRHALGLLAAGRSLGIFPEGHRSPTGRLGPGQAGAAYVALASPAPAIPVAISGPYRPGGLTVRVGPAVDLGAHRGRRLRSGELAAVCDQAIMGAIAALLPAARGAGGAQPSGRRAERRA